MVLLRNDNTNPAFNLALEEYALTQLRREMIVLWCNDRAVIIGKNQNAMEEVDLDFVRQNNIAVIRRQSGGGAVFHDLGNINYTVIGPMRQGDFNNYTKFTQPIIGFLRSLGLHAELKGRNDLLLNGMKFSGNAQAAKNGFIMHHGTILYNADFGDLTGALKPKPAKIHSKGVASVRARVTNIASHLAQPMPVEVFFEALYNWFLRSNDAQPYFLTARDLAAVDRLVNQKYSRWEWNIGHSPKYIYQKTERFPLGSVELHMNAENGVIQQIKIMGDFFGLRDIAELESQLRGVRHDQLAIQNALQNIDISQYISGCSPEQLLSLF